MQSVFLDYKKPYLNDIDYLINYIIFCLKYP